MNPPDEIFEHMAVDWLATDLGFDSNLPEFEQRKKKATALFRRYWLLKSFMDKPIVVWPEDLSEDIDFILGRIDKKLTAAEEVLGIIS